MQKCAQNFEKKFKIFPKVLKSFKIFQFKKTQLANLQSLVLQKGAQKRDILFKAGFYSGLIFSVKLSQTLSGITITGFLIE